MMGLFDHLANFVGLRKKQVNVLVVGLNNSGKSTVINHFKNQNERCTDIIPTIGFSVEKFAFKNIGFTAFDMSGQDRYRSLWEHYYKGCHGIIFIVDSNDKLRIVVVKEELDMLLQHPEIAGQKLPILFLANKIDLPNSLTTINLVTCLGLDKIQNKPWHIQATNAITGDGLQTAIEWLTDQIRDIHINRR
ncbi:PREDICTED: ADP-ribosylation factor-like protein 6 isoform X1 [Ceratosolen solmsi marchali]|uniref:ADP-ribosylation factor-like protein 6 n=1 Tax=Ceratosolen solmsi marchali TaxID=326594 RepID=A0AAJ6YR85_9HYME|nr:PREDICTED: ADP-ribosylation factor-like protein 6 isoform X1 [Ceratosolen solmsi marchali]